MSRLKVWLVTTLAALLGTIAGFAVYFVLRLHIHGDGFVRGLPYVAFAVVASAVYLIVIRTLRCPHCGRHFNWQNFRWPSFQLGGDRLGDEMPERLCPGCGHDIYKSPALPGTIGANRDTR